MRKPDISRRLLVALAIIALAFPPQVAHASVDGTIGATITANDRRSVGINTNANLPVNAQPAIAYTYGTGANQVQVLYQATRTFSGSSDTLNLTSGLADSYGTAVNLTAGKVFFVANLSTTNTITVGAGTTPVTTLLNSTGTLTLNPGAFFVTGDPSAAGWTVTASTACNFNVSGTSGQAYQVVVMGLGS